MTKRGKVIKKRYSEQCEECKTLVYYQTQLEMREAGGYHLCDTCKEEKDLLEPISISYAILTHNETTELKKLLDFLLKYKDDSDEIVILDDFSDNTETVELLDFYTPFHEMKFEKRHLLKDFASQKNYLKNMCSGDYIFNIDADETLNISLMRRLKSILRMNKGTDLFWVPRLNIVRGLTLEHVNKWHWTIDKAGGIGDKNSSTHKAIYDKNSEEYKLLQHYNLIIEEKDTNDGWLVWHHNALVNWPQDYQGRLWKNRPNILWKKPVHEMLTGYKTYGHLPAETLYSLIHIKDIKKQEQQNEFYNTIL